MGEKNKTDFSIEEWAINWKQQEKELHEFRGKVLTKSVYIECLLDFILSKYFCNNTTDVEFRTGVLGKEFFTFMQKIKIFSELQIHKRPHFKGEYDGYSEKLFNLAEIRNAFAHGHLDTEEKTILYLRGDKQKTLQIDEQLQKQFFENINSLDKMLVAVYIYLEDEKENKSQA
ncbi:MAG: hypothetical protein KJ955_02010 [Nanoarchaeota archaeon]|nr:hypothetical protein [Nanoarchaeota archaeon]